MTDTSLATITSGAAFKDVMREKILTAFMGLIPAEKLDELVDREVTAFFETDQLLTVNETTVEVDNPKYEPIRGYGYGNDRKMLQSTLAFGSKMTPFRQLVWSELFTHLQPRVHAIIKDEESALRKKLDTWLLDTVVPDSNVAHTANFNQLATAMSATMFSRTLVTANQNAASILEAALMGLVDPTAAFEATRRARSFGSTPGEV